MTLLSSLAPFCGTTYYINMVQHSFLDSLFIYKHSCYALWIFSTTTNKFIGFQLHPLSLKETIIQLLSIVMDLVQICKHQDAQIQLPFIGLKRIFEVLFLTLTQFLLTFVSLLSNTRNLTSSGNCTILLLLVWIMSTLIIQGNVQV